MIQKRTLLLRFASLTLRPGEASVDQNGEELKNDFNYDYLFSMKMQSMTIEKLEELKKEEENILIKIKRITKIN